MCVGMASDCWHCGCRSAPRPAAEPAGGACARRGPARSRLDRAQQRVHRALLDVTKKHSPESASAEGLSQYDEQISQPTKQDDDASIAETKAVQTKLTRALALEHDKYVEQDLSILLHRIRLSLRSHDFSEAHEVPYENASEDVFQGLR